MLKTKKKSLDYDAIKALRGQGYGHKKIAQMLGYSENSVKSILRRNKL